MKSILDIEQLTNFLKQNKIQPFRKKQIYYNIFKNSIIEFSQMTDIPKDLQSKLKNNFFIISLKPDKIIETYNTVKISFATPNGHPVESVIIFHYSKHTKWKLNRITLCISSQSWCAMWCKFCVTWKLWFIKNLEYYQIIEQILFANNYIKNKLWKKEDWTYYKVRNVVFMWMWEPLTNYDNVKKSLNFILDRQFLSLSHRRVTISTCWILDWIDKLVKDKVNVMLAVSLHAGTQQTRQKIMPVANTYNIKTLTKKLTEYTKATKNRIFYEYIMIKNITDTPKEALALAKLLKNQLAHVNLIPYNTNPSIGFERSDLEQIYKFKEILEENWLTVTVRDSMWEELKWACWQLGYEKILKINK